VLPLHGLINRSIQCFLRDTYGPAQWDAVALKARLGFSGFEAMLSYDADLTERVIEAACQVLNRPRDSILEDLGTYLVSHRNVEAVRRLLRFGGVTFGGFLNSLEDLPERGRLAVPDLDLPDLRLVEGPDGTAILRARSPMPGMGHVALGLLRAMADDYGALVFLDHLGTEAGWEIISIRILDRAWTAGRRFELARGVA
jgi:hypothetical protein